MLEAALVSVLRVPLKTSEANKSYQLNSNLLLPMEQMMRCSLDRELERPYLPLDVASLNREQELTWSSSYGNKTRSSF